MFAMQAQEETSRGIEIYLAVTALYVVSAFASTGHGLHREAGARARLRGQSTAADTDMLESRPSSELGRLPQLRPQGLLLQHSS
jgi:hypothetical protein